MRALLAKIAVAAVSVGASIITPILQASAGPALVFDAANGRVIYAEDQDDLWYPASLTKIMTAYLTFEALKAGRITLDQKIKVSEKAHVQPPSKIGMPVGAELTVELAMKAMIVKSANDASIMLAEAVGGTEEAFIQHMNDTARRLGMSRTRFVNPNGLPAPEQVTTARDLAKLARAVLRDFPEQAHLWSMTELHIGKLKLGSHNHLLRSYEGADGIKTGFICDSGFNVVASASRDGRKMIAVVLGESSGRDRSVRAASLMEHGFQMHGWKQLFNAATIDTLAVPADAKGPQSIRERIVSWDCGNRRRPVAKRKGAPATAAAAATAAPGKAPAKAKAAAAKAPAGAPAPAAQAAPAQSASGSAAPAARAKAASRPAAAAPAKATE